MDTQAAGVDAQPPRRADTPTESAMLAVVRQQLAPYRGLLDGVLPQLPPRLQQRLQELIAEIDLDVV